MSLTLNGNRLFKCQIKRVFDIRKCLSIYDKPLSNSSFFLFLYKNRLNTILNTNKKLCVQSLLLSNMYCYSLTRIFDSRLYSRTEICDTEIGCIIGHRY